MLRSGSAAIAPRTHLPALDGLRGLAILLVLFHHAWVDLPAPSLSDLLIQRVTHVGWVGVDLFFVLSGFLITGILLDTRENQHYFRNFYMRRVLRIFPLYYTFLVFLFWVAPLLGLMRPDEASLLAKNQPWYWTYTLNVLITREGWNSTPWHTGHLWSLAVEEQFYLAWPVMVFLLRRRQLAWLTAGAVVGGLVLRVVLRLDGYSPAGIHVLTPIRLDTLAMGALLAIQAREPGGLSRMTRWVRPAMIVAGTVLAILLVVTPFSPEGFIMQAVGYSAIVCFAGGLMVRAITAAPGSRANALWHQPVMRFFGRYSYCIYVVHYPIILLLSRYVTPFDRLPTVGGVLLPTAVLFAALVVACSVGVALVSWHLLENPFLRMKDRFAD